MHFHISKCNNNNNIINYNIIMCISVVAQVVLRLARPLIMWCQGHVPVVVVASYIIIYSEHPREWPWRRRTHTNYILFYSCWQRWTRLDIAIGGQLSTKCVDIYKKKLKLQNKLPNTVLLPYTVIVSHSYYMHLSHAITAMFTIRYFGRICGIYYIPT